MESGALEATSSEQASSSAVEDSKAAASEQHLQIVGEASSCRSLLYHHHLLGLSWPAVDGMQRVDCHQFYQFGQQLFPLNSIKEGDKLHQHIFQINAAVLWLTWFLNDSVIPLNVCKTDGHELLNILAPLVPGNIFEAMPPDRDLTPMEIFQIPNNLRDFETVLTAELHNVATYFVSKKSIYDTADLIERAENVLPDEIRTKLSKENIVDIKEAGKCIAFNLPTAAGFHTMHAVEPGLLKWYKSVLKKDPPVRNWGEYIKGLREAGAKAEILLILDQLRNLYRNELLHPEDVLTMEEAIDLFDLGKAAIRSMVLEMG